MEINISHGKKDLWKGGSFLVYINGSPRAAFGNINDAIDYEQYLTEKHASIIFHMQYRALTESNDWKKENSLWRHWKYGVRKTSEAYELL